MSIPEKPEGAEPKDEDTAVETEVKAPIVDPLRGLKKANKTLQKERDDLKAKLDASEAEAKRAKLTDDEKTKTDLATLRRERDEAKADAERAKKERETERLVSQLVAKHGLRDPDFGETVLKKFNPEEHDDFDAWAKALKKDKKYEPFFGNLTSGQVDRVTDDEGNDVEPEPPRGGTGRTTKKPNASEHEDFARKQWPGNKDKQQAYLDNIAAIGRGRG